MSILSRNDDYFKKLYNNVSRNTRDELDRMSGVSEDTIKHKNNLEDIELGDSDYDDYFGSMFKSARSELGLDNKTSNNALGNSLFDSYETKKKDGRVAEQIARNKVNGLLSPKNTSSNSNNTTNSKDEDKPFYKKIPVASDIAGGLIGGVAGAGRTYAEWDYKYDMMKAERYKNLANNKNLSEERRQHYQEKYEEQVAKAEYWKEENVKTSQKMLDYANSFSTIKEDDNMLVKAVKGAFGSLGNIATATIAGGGNGIIGMGVSTYGQGLEEAKDMNLSEEDTHKYALSTAFIESGSELFFPGAKGIKTFLTTGSIKQAIKEAGVSNVKEFVKQVGEEFGQEAGTEVLNIINERRFEDKDGNPIASNDWRELGERIMVAGLSGAIMGGVTEGAGSLNKANNNQTQNSVLSQQEEANIKPETVSNTVNQQNIIPENANKAQFLTPQAQKLNDAFGFDVSNLIEENINEDVKTENSTSEIANNTIPEANNNIDTNINAETENNTIFKGKTIDAEGNTVYVKEDGSTINAKLFDLFAESNNIDVNSITRLSETEMQTATQNESIDSFIETVEDSVMEEGAEATVQSLNESLNSGAIDNSTYDTAVNLVNEINTELNTETQQESVQNNTTQHDSTQNNADTLSNKAKTIEEAVNNTNTTQQEATQGNTTQQEAVNVGSTQHNSTQSNTKTGILIPNGITAEQLDKAYKQDPQLKSRMEEASKVRQNAEAKLKEVQKEVEKQAETVNKIDKKVNKSKTVKEVNKKAENTKNTSSETELSKLQTDFKKHNDNLMSEIQEDQAEAEKYWAEEANKEYLDKVEKLNKVVNGKDFKAVFTNLKLEAIEKLTVKQDAVNQLGKAIGREVIFFKANSKNAPNGFMKNGIIFLNGDYSGSAMTQVLGHETFHTLKTTNKETFNKLVEYGKENFTAEEITQFLSKIDNTAEVNKLKNNPDLLSEEMLAEAFGNDFANKEFWQGLEKKNKSLFEKIKDIIAKIFNRAKSYKTDFLTQKHIDELRVEFEGIFGDLTNNHLYGEFASNDVAESLQDTYIKEAKASKKKNNTSSKKIKETPKSNLNKNILKVMETAKIEAEKEVAELSKYEYNKLSDYGKEKLDSAKEFLSKYDEYLNTDSKYLDSNGRFNSTYENDEFVKRLISIEAHRIAKDVYKDETYSELSGDGGLNKGYKDAEKAIRQNWKESTVEYIEELKDKAVEEVEAEVKNKTSNELFKDKELVDIYKAFKKLSVPFEYSEHTGYGTADLLRADSAKELKKFVNSLKAKFDVKNVKSESNWTDYKVTAKVNGKDMIFKAYQAPIRNTLKLTVTFKEKVNSGVYKYSNYKNDIADVKSLVDMIEAQTSKKVLAPKKKNNAIQKYNDMLEGIKNGEYSEAEIEQLIKELEPIVIKGEFDFEKWMDLSDYQNKASKIADVKAIAEAHGKTIYELTPQERYLYEIVSESATGAFDIKSVKFYKDGSMVINMAHPINDKNYTTIIDKDGNKVNKYIGGRAVKTIDERELNYDFIAPIKAPKSSPSNDNNDDIKFSTRKGKEFDEWFKGSVMVKENGKPQLFYHTTNAKFDDFDDNAKTVNGKRYGAGHYFTDKRPQPGYGYGKNRLSVNLKIENPLDFSKKIDIDKAKNIARDLDKEFGATKYGEYRTEKLEKTIKSFGENGEIPVYFFSGAIQIENSDYRDILREYGYDGIIEYSGGEHYVVAFSNDQVNIKSRVDENGIRFSTRSKEETAKITAPLQKVAEKTNNLQLRAGIHKLQGVKVDKNVDLVGIFNNAIDSMASNTESTKANIKTLKNALMEDGISSKEANAIAKYFTNIIDVAKETFTETTPVSKNVITSSSYKEKSKGIKAKTGEAFDSFYTHIADTNHAGKMVNNVFYNKAKTTKNSFGIVDNIFTEALTDKNGNVVDKSLKEMFNNVFKADDIIEFMDYVLHKHNISRALQGKYVFFKEDGSPMESTDSAKIVKQYEAKHPDFASRQEELTGWINTFMETWAVDTGLMTKDFHSMLKEMYNHYVPTNRSFADHEELFGGGYGGKGFVDKSKPTKRAEKGGSARDIIDLQESIVNLVSKTVRTAKMNEVGQELVKAIENNPNMKGIAEIVDKPDINVDNVVRVLVEGEPVYVEVHNKSLLEMLEQVHTPEFHAVVEMSKKTLNVVKQLITSKNPLFAITNIFRDYQTYMINSTEANVFKRWGSIGKALKAIKNNTKEYQLYKAMGISSSGMMAKNNTKTVQNITGLKSIIDKDTGALLGKKDINNSKDLKSRFIKGWNKFNEAIDTLTGTSETTFRLAEFINSLDRGLTVEEATVNAMEVTVDFSRSGDYTRFADASVMYLNAGVQGLDRVARQVKKHPIQTLTRSMVHIAAPAIMLAALNGGDDDYEMLDSRTKDNNFLIPLWLFGGEEGKFLKLPKAREYGVVAMLCERLIYGRGEEGSFDNLWRSVKENMAPADVFTSNILTDIAKATDNEAKDFAGRYIVPSALQDKEAKDQWDDDTTVLAKYLGQLLNFSPKFIDYYLDSYSGIVGDLVMPILTPSTYASGDSKDATSNILAPITKKFVADNAYSSSATSKYYDNLDELTKVIKKEQEGLTTAEKKKLTTETEAFKSAINEAYGNDITDFNDMLKDDSLTNSEKRKIRQARNEAMKQANEAIKKFLSPKTK